MKKLYALLLVVVICSVSGCYRNDGSEDTSMQKEKLYVFAAASLTGAFSQIAKEFEKAENGDVSVVLNFAGSQALVTSIMSGAKADIFAPADMETMQKLEGKGLVRRYEVFARNRLALVRSTGSKYEISGLSDLGKEGLKLAVADSSVPVGAFWARASAAALKAGLVSKEQMAFIEKNTVTRELNVRDVLSKVLLNETDAGIVYGTDAFTADKGKVMEVRVPLFASVYTDYPAAVLAESKSRYAQKLLEYLISDRGRDLLKGYGFIVH